MTVTLDISECLLITALLVMWLWSEHFKPVIKGKKEKKRVELGKCYNLSHDIMLWHVRRYYWPMMAVSKSGVFRVMLPDVLRWQFGLLSWHNERTGCEHFSCLVIVLLWWQFMFFFVTIEYVIVCFVITIFWSLLLLEWKRLSLICLQYDTVLFAIALLLVTEWFMIPVCPSLVCFFNRGNIEGTNSLKILCLMFVYVLCKFLSGLILWFLGVFVVWWLVCRVNRSQIEHCF